MKKVKLIEIAHGRSGDKGNGSNVGIIARHPDILPVFERCVNGRESERPHEAYL
jgi:hypothetical protein